MIEIAGNKEFKDFCLVCGLPIYEGDKGCKRYHKIKNPKRKRYSGKSKSENRFNNY